MGRRVLLRKVVKDGAVVFGVLVEALVDGGDGGEPPPTAPDPLPPGSPTPLRSTPPPLHPPPLVPATAIVFSSIVQLQVFFAPQTYS